MKKVLVVSLVAAAVAVASLAQQPASGGAQKAAAPEMSKGDVDMGKLVQALEQKRRQLFAAGMSNLTAQQMEVFWSVYADFEKEKDANMSARMSLLKTYVDGFSTLTDADIVKMVTAASDLQKQGTDLRLKYFGIMNQKLGAKVAGRFAHIDDYLTTVLRLSILDNMPALASGPSQ